jgi:hypothetical protein
VWRVRDPMRAGAMPVGGPMTWPNLIAFLGVLALLAYIVRTIGRDE